ncbi:MAG: hscB [Myxococcaceae bacterium]|nr:hscB [Myxococcaceae bacterium]
MTDPFEVLGVARRFSLDRAALEQRHRDLSRTLHPDRYVQSPPGERRMALERAVAVNEAFRALRDPLTRAEALLAAHGLAVGDADRPSQALLMEVMELRESLDEARRSPEKVTALLAQVRARSAAEEAALAAAFDADAAPGTAALAAARDALVRLKYFRRFEEEADDALDI